MCSCVSRENIGLATTVAFVSQESKLQVPWGTTENERAVFGVVCAPFAGSQLVTLRTAHSVECTAAHSKILMWLMLFEGKPVGAICRGSSVLCTAKCIEGRKMTSFPGIKTDVKHAGSVRALLLEGPGSRAARTPREGGVISHEIYELTSAQCCFSSKSTASFSDDVLQPQFWRF